MSPTRVGWHWQLLVCQLWKRRLRWLSCFVIFAACLQIPADVCAQAPNANADPFGPPVRRPEDNLFGAPVARATRLPQLSDLTQVKLDRHQGELQLVMMLESFRSEKRTGRVVQLQQVQRTRKVPNAEGELVDQVFTVQIPVATEGEIEAKIPAGRKPVTRPASEFRFFNLGGEELTPDAASQILQSLQAALLLDRYAGELPPLPDLYQQALRETCLVIVTEEAVREFARPLSGEILPARVFQQEIVPAERR